MVGHDACLVYPDIWRIATHYSQAELSNLIGAADKVGSTESRKTHTTTWLRRAAS